MILWLLNFINNFDLTCCQLWYNGFEFNGSRLEDIKQKAYLNEDYMGFYLVILKHIHILKNNIDKLNLELLCG